MGQGSGHRAGGDQTHREEAPTELAGAGNTRRRLIISGSLVGAAVYAGETYRDSKAELEGERQALRLQVALERDLSGIDVAGQDLTGLHLRGKSLRNANLAGCDLSGMDLSDADFKGSNLRGTNLEGSLLTYADLRLVDARRSSLKVQI